MKNYKARGIVLNTLKYGESSLIVHMLTDTAGRRNYIVQGIGASRSRNAKTALLQPFFPVEFVGLDSGKSDLHRLKDLRSGRVLRSTPFDVRKKTISLFLAEVLYRLVREVEPDSDVFEFVWDAVDALDGAVEGVSNFHLWFLVRLSAYLGFYPGNAYLGMGWFDIQEGLFTPIRPQHTLYMDEENSSVLSSFMECGRDSIADVPLTGIKRSSFMNSILDYFGYHLDSVGQIKSVQILREIF